MALAVYGSYSGRYHALQALDRLWAMRDEPQVSSEAERILDRHVDRKPLGV